MSLALFSLNPMELLVIGGVVGGALLVAAILTVLFVLTRKRPQGRSEDVPEE
jgi:hypothetical protein